MTNIQTNPPSDRNSLIQGDSLLNIEDTIDKATDVLQYLSLVHEDDRQYSISNDARLWISDCAIDALRYAEHRLGVLRDDIKNGEVA